MEILEMLPIRGGNRRAQIPKLSRGWSPRDCTFSCSALREFLTYTIALRRSIRRAISRKSLRWRGRELLAALARTRPQEL
jgi:hypothetical protein